MKLAAIILVGGASSRMGADKAALSWNGRSAVDRLEALAREVGADRVLTAGGGEHGLERVDDPAPGGGPVSGIVAGIAALRATGHGRVVVLAVDAPTIRPTDLAPLMAAAAPGAAYEGLNLPLVLDIAATPDDAGPGWPVARLIDRAGLARLACPSEATERLRGANTPDERDRLLVELAEAECATKGGAAC
jgi:molybdenum cofactor guanylyltransferase